MKKNFKIILLIIAIAISIVSFSIYHFYSIPKQQVQQKRNEIRILVQGWIEFPGWHIYPEGTKFSHVLQDLKVKTGADLKNIDIEEILINDKEYYIPKINLDKLTWSKLEITDLKEIGINQNISQEIINLKNKKIKPTWELIDKISGIGPITIEKLKNKLDLNR
ncbi:hypothetical protein EI74_0131 [Mycoplasma testudineum]|uniref:Competence protein ComEA n=1 Tax=Mycoplasma testudineum TaxID=244584 RepID=A0A4R6IH13_9MOLU|nr:hypothetical protein [Mycoplasma testudineum]OYD27135.1 hypothetical protein CG473_00630 [Mycoplasma testudineum]TDO21111.1 hypothetical protein EI74_0131 [Mycoplasma testudineum]